MPKLVDKIEDLIEDVASNITFKPQSEPDHQIESSPPQVTFPRMLDFAFPHGTTPTPVVQVGEVIYVGDGVVHATGLDKAKIDEVIEIDTNSGIEKALILGIREERVEAVVLGDYSHIKRADQVRSTGGKLRIPVGESVLGRVINPLGLPLDGKGPLKSTHTRDVEFAAPGVMDRTSIHEPLHTGVMVIDTTIPIGRGQRELVIGDRKTGKSRTMLDIICNQAQSGVHCIYVGVGVQASKAKATLEMLEERGAMKYTTLVLSLADEPPSLQYISPYVGAAIGEFYMYQGQHALIIFDDLSKQAKAYRQVSLLLKRSPGRDAYPGDIFFLHSRLLERASKLSDDMGGGSLTAMPIAETQAGDVSDYIITNLMSITDGHIYLDANMMHEGVLPAVNSGTSVSRIGGKVQTKMLQKVGELAGRIMARYNEVKSFETINTEVAEDTIRDIKRGKRIREILAQDSELNLSDDEEVMLLGLATSSRMDHFEAEHISVFKDKIVPFYRKQNLSEFQKVQRETRDIEDINPHLDQIFTSFCQEFNLPLNQTPPKAS